MGRRTNRRTHSDARQSHNHHQHAPHPTSHPPSKHPSIQADPALRASLETISAYYPATTALFVATISNAQTDEQAQVTLTVFRNYLAVFQRNESTDGNEGPNPVSIITNAFRSLESHNHLISNIELLNKHPETMAFVAEMAQTIRTTEDGDAGMAMLRKYIASVERTEHMANEERPPISLDAEAAPGAALSEPNPWVLLALGLFGAVTLYVMVRSSKHQGRAQWLGDMAQGGPVILVMNLVMAYTLEKTGLIIPLDFGIRVLEFLARYPGGLLWTYSWALLKTAAALILVTLIKMAFTFSLSYYALRIKTEHPTQRHCNRVGAAVAGVVGIFLTFRVLGNLSWPILAVAAIQIWAARPWPLVMDLVAGFGMAMWFDVLRGLLRSDLYTWIFLPETWKVLRTAPPQPGLVLGASLVVMALYIRGFSIVRELKDVLGSLLTFPVTMLEWHTKASRAFEGPEAPEAPAE